MPDRLLYPLLVLIALALIALANVWPQGQGARSPKPFGGPTWAETHPKPKTPPGKAEDRKIELRGPF